MADEGRSLKFTYVQHKVHDFHLMMFHHEKKNHLSRALIDSEWKILGCG